MSDANVPGDGSDELVPLHSAAMLVNASRTGWSAPTTTSWQNEATLRDLLVSHPSLLPGVADPAVAAVKEFPIPSAGRVDVLAVESSGLITVCEAKLSTNAEMRRTIVGQVLAYVSGLAGLSLDELEERWERCSDRSLVEDVLGDDVSEGEERAFREAVSASLENGRFRVMLAVDVLSAELRAIVGYLAVHMDVEVAALEIAYARSGDVEILVPRSYGIELSSTQPRRPGRSPGYRKRVADVRAAIVARADSAAPGFGRVVGTVLDGLADQIDYLYSGDEAMLDPVVVAAASPARQPSKIITTQKTVGIRVCFGWCKNIGRDRLERALELLEANAAIAPAVSEVRSSDFTKRPILRFNGVLDQPGAVESLLQALRVLAS